MKYRCGAASQEQSYMTELNVLMGSPMEAMESVILCAKKPPKPYPRSEPSMEDE